MPVLFHRIDAGPWNTTRICAPAGTLSLAPVAFEPIAREHAIAAGECLLMKAADAPAWALYVRGEQRLLHNGTPVTAALRVLVHRDALATEGHEPVYFSTEEAPRVEPYAGAAKAACPRCRSEIVAGEPAVRCPGCGVFHHETDERNCWSYTPSCALCPQPSALDGGLQWTPEAL